MDAPPATTPTTPVIPPSGTAGGTLPASPPTPGLSFTDEGLKSHQALAKFPDLDSLGKGYVELEKKIGERPQGIKPVTAESSPDDITAYRTAMGIPEKPDGYEVGPLSFPEAATPTDAQMGAFKGMAHGLHLTPAQVQGILQWYAQDMSAQWTAMDLQRTESNKATMDGLTKKYGALAPQLITTAQRYVERRWGAAGIEALDFGQGGMGSNPLMIEMLIESAKLTGHDKFIIAESGGALMDGPAAQAKRAELYDKLAKARREGQDGEAATIVQEITRLQPHMGT
jgi:hypothetical protein